MDKLSPGKRSANMAQIKSKNSKPELTVRRAAHELGYRFRLHRKDLPGKPDLVFPKRMAAIFVHGCFWHIHPDPDCKDAVLPKSRTDYWHPKLERNVQRDQNNVIALEALGWRILTLWECETKDRAWLVQRIQDFLG
jgi:DNA mismatch endonuclease (patch repair protein)